MTNAFRCLIRKWDPPLKSGIRLRCVYLWMGLSKTKISDGRTVTVVRTPKITPFIITIPISRPSVSCIKHRAKNPATVVRELPASDVNVL